VSAEHRIGSLVILGRQAFINKLILKNVPVLKASALEADTIVRFGATTLAFTSLILLANTSCLALGKPQGIFMTGDLFRDMGVNISSFHSA
jgi:hypothetical protein